MPGSPSGVRECLEVIIDPIIHAVEIITGTVTEHSPEAHKLIMRIDIFTLFPQMFVGPLDNSIIGRAVAQGLVNFNIHNIRDYTHDKHHTADDYAYGGGAGMVMKPEPVFEAVETVKSKHRRWKARLIHHSTDASGTAFLPTGGC